MSSQFSEMLVHVPSLRRYARALSGNTSDGDGLTYKTLDCAKSLLHFRPKDITTKVWLFSVMHNLTLDFFSDLHGDISHSSILPYVNPSDLGNDNEDELDIKGALAHLTLEQRETYLLTTLEEFRYDDVCQVMGINKAQLITSLQNARETMCDYLFKETFEDFRQVQ